MRSLAALWLLTLCCPALGGAVEDSASATLAAFRAEDLESLRRLAETESPDPWLVVDELAARGEYDAALALARAAPRPETANLAAYVDAQRARPTERHVRSKAKAAFRALRCRRESQVLMLSDEAAGVDVSGVRLLHARGVALRSLWRPEQCAEAFLACANGAERLGWLTEAVYALHECAASAYARSKWRVALGAWKRCLRIEEHRGQSETIGALLGNIGNAHIELGNYKEALAYYERAHARFKETDDVIGAAMAIGNIGLAYERLGQYRKALSFLERALTGHEEFRNRAAMAWTLANIGLVHDSVGNYPKARDFLKRALALSEAIGDGAGVAKTLGDIGLVHEHLGNYDLALEHHQRALKMKEAFGDRAGAALTLGNIGIVHHSLGRFARALTLYEQALKEHEELDDRSGQARMLDNIGSVHRSLGNYEMALTFYKRALAIKRDIGDRAGAARILASVGNVHYALGRNEKALARLHEALEIEQRLGDRSGAARTLGSIGNVYYTLGNFEKALDFYTRAVGRMEELGDRVGVASTLGNIALVHRRLGNHAEALEFHERARAKAVELGTLETEIENLWGLATAYLRLAKPDEAAAKAREAVEKLPRLVSRLPEDLGATARGHWAGLFDVGIRAGLALHDPEAVAYFLESGRAGTLLEGLALREQLHAVVLPPELRDAERAAREREREALKRYRAALNAGDEADALWTELEATRERVVRVVHRIQREAQAQAALLYPEAAPLDDVRASLAAGDALVLYGLLNDRAVALVVRPKEARILDLGGTEAIHRAADAFQRAVSRPDERGVSVPPHEQLAFLTARLTKMLVEPLGIDRTVTRLLISPDGALAYVPFALLAGGREVAYVASGTSHRFLRREERGERGKDVLALGDPDYGMQDSAVVTVMRGSEGLHPLPATRLEVEAVGDRLLLGAKATVRELKKALARQTRWRAVHLACHGRVDPERPALSSLAFTATDDDNGFLRCIDVYRMKVPADLVVLSACQTARGKVYRAEGVVGFVQAFMFAGTPRVLVSLWKVDDEATKALMVKFYEQWKTHSPAAALNAAQRFVASHERWKHPYFWAAWQLWGLPD